MAISVLRHTRRDFWNWTLVIDQRANGFTLAWMIYCVILLVEPASAMLRTPEEQTKVVRSQLGIRRFCQICADGFIWSCVQSEDSAMGGTVKPILSFYPSMLHSTHAHNMNNCVWHTFGLFEIPILVLKVQYVDFVFLCNQMCLACCCPLPVRYACALQCSALDLDQTIHYSIHWGRSALDCLLSSNINNFFCWTAPDGDNFQALLMT